MTEMVTIPRDDYDRLMAIAEDFADTVAVEEFRRKFAAGEEELIPAEAVKRIIDGEHPVRVFRELRGMNQSELGRASGVNRVVIADIETGRRKGSLSAFRSLAGALGVTIDDLV